MIPSQLTAPFGSMLGGFKMAFVKNLSQEAQSTTFISSLNCSPTHPACGLFIENFSCSFCSAQHAIALVVTMIVHIGVYQPLDFVECFTVYW